MSPCCLWLESLYSLYTMLMFRNVAYLLFYFLKKISESDSILSLPFDLRSQWLTSGRYIFKGTLKRNHLRTITFLGTIPPEMSGLNNNGFPVLLGSVGWESGHDTVGMLCLYSGRSGTSGGKTQTGVTWQLGLKASGSSFTLHLVPGLWWLDY